MTVKKFNRSIHIAAVLRFAIIILVSSVAILAVKIFELTVLSDQQLLAVLGGVFLLHAVPTLLLHINHSRWYRKARLEYSSSDEFFFLTESNNKRIFRKSDISHATRHAALGALMTSRSPSLLGWSGYYFLDIVFRDGQTLRIPSMMLPDREYKKIGCGNYEKEFEILPLLNNARE